MKSSEIIEIWLSSAYCSCFARAQCLWVLSSRRKQLQRPRFDLSATWCNLKWPEKAQKIFIKHMRSYENVVFQVRILVTCYILSDSLDTFKKQTGVHQTRSDRCLKSLKIIKQYQWSPEAIQLERLYSENFDQYQTIKNNINDLWTMFEKVSLSPLSVNWGCLNQLWTPETMRSIEKPIIFDLRSLV